MVLLLVLPRCHRFIVDVREVEEVWEDFYAFRNKVFVGLAAIGLVIMGVIWWLIRRRTQKRQV